MLTPQGKYANQKFCSGKCHYDYRNHLRTITHGVNCERCNKLFTLKNKAYKNRGGGRFCSKECSTRKLNVNEFYFDAINSEAQAYWLGLLFSDGSQGFGKICLSLQETDRAHLEKFKKAIESEHCISNFISGFGSMMFKIQISSKKLANTLNSLGCVQAKSLIIEYPNIPSALDRHFIRGVFDGDGCIGLNKNKRVQKSYWKWHIYSGSPAFIDRLHKKLAVVHATKVGNPPRVVQVGNKAYFSKLYDFLYKDATIWLPRKREIFEQGLTNNFVPVPY